MKKKLDIPTFSMEEYQQYLAGQGMPPFIDEKGKSHRRKPSKEVIKLVQKQNAARKAENHLYDLVRQKLWEERNEYHVKLCLVCGTPVRYENIPIPHDCDWSFLNPDLCIKILGYVQGSIWKEEIVA